MSKRKYVNPEMDIIMFRPEQIMASSGHVTSFGASFSDTNNSSNDVWGSSESGGGDFNDFGAVDVDW